MIKEKLIIKNFAGFDHIEIDLKPINIFIGPQAAGKSVIIKLVYFFKSLIYEYTTYSENIDILKGNGFSFLVSRDFKEYFPPDSWSHKTFKIVFFSDYNGKEIFIELKRKEHSNNIEVKTPPLLMEMLLSFQKNTIQKKYPKIFSSELYNENQSDYYKQAFIPAGRSFFSTIQNSIFTLLRKNQTIDPFLIEFGSNYENAKFHKCSLFYKERISLENISELILHGKYKRENNLDYLIHSDGRKVNLMNASSGQQETLPLILFLLYILNEGIPTTLYIEEPEAHLYPDAQKKIVQLLAQVYNTQNKQLFITTHSPYILASFNNLIEAGNIIKTKPGSADKVYKIIPKEEVLSIDDLIAYSIKDGKKEILLDKENNLISQNILDDVSNDISKEFNALLDIEFGE